MRKSESPQSRIFIYFQHAVLTMEDEEQGPVAEMDGCEVVIKGSYKYSMFMFSLAATLVYLLLILSGLSWVVEEWHGSSPEDAALLACGSWGLVVFMGLATVFFFFTEDRRCEVLLTEEGIRYKGRHFFRPPRDVEVGYHDIDTLKLEQEEMRQLFGRIYLLELEDCSKGSSWKGENRVRLYSDGFSREDFVTICETLNTRLVLTRDEGSKLSISDSSVGIFHKPNQELRQILDKKIAAGELKTRV